MLVDLDRIVHRLNEKGTQASEHIADTLLGLVEISLHQRPYSFNTIATLGKAVHQLNTNLQTTSTYLERTPEWDSYEVVIAQVNGLHDGLINPPLLHLGDSAILGARALADMV